MTARALLGTERRRPARQRVHAEQRDAGGRVFAAAVEHDRGRRAPQLRAARGRTVQCWGGNDVGELGDGTTTPHSFPEPVTGVGGAIAVVAGFNHTCALRRGRRRVTCWGANGYGQLGDGTTTDSALPVAVVGLAARVDDRRRLQPHLRRARERRGALLGLERRRPAGRRDDDRQRDAGGRRVAAGRHGDRGRRLPHLRGRARTARRSAGDRTIRVSSATARRPTDRRRRRSRGSACEARQGGGRVVRRRRLRVGVRRQRGDHAQWQRRHGERQRG